MWDLRTLAQFLANEIYSELFQDGWVYKILRVANARTDIV